MSVFEHNHRARIYNPAQHPYHHSADEFAYTSGALPPTITTLSATLDYIIAVLYPNTKPAVANVAALPSVGNTINDYRVVADDGDGKAAAYRWEQREGEASATWHKIADVDWGTDSVLQEWQNRTQDLFVMRWGYDGLDNTGVPIVGTLAGQVVYGGKSASTNLTFYPNSGDGAGAITGFVQTAATIRPAVTTNTIDFGTSAVKFRTGYFGTSVLAGTMTLSGGTVADSSGAISFGTVNLLTSGTLGAGATTVTSLIVGTTTITSHTLADSGGTFGFGTVNLSTTGTLAAGATTVTSLIVGTTTITSHTLADSGGTFSFGSVNLSTTGTLSAGATTTTSVTGGNLQMASQTLSSTNTNGNIIIAPNGVGQIQLSALTYPTTDAASDLGKTASRFQNLYLSGSLGDGTNTCAISVIMSLRSINVSAASGKVVSYNGTQWVATDPDTEVFHDLMQHLTGVGTDGDAGHSQFPVSAGRSGGQTIKGDTAASGNLTLDSTAHATKGLIKASSDVVATTDAAYSSGWTGTNLGGASNRWNNVYTAGEHIGFRLENLASDPGTSAQKIGRVWWNTTTGYIGGDNGSSVQRLSILRYQTDTSWDGATTSKSVVVSGIDATQAIWQLKDNTNNYEVMQVKLTSTSTTNVTITVNVALPAGSYRLIGLQ